MPFLLVIASFFLNYKFNSSNEIIILKQYFSLKHNLFVSIILTILITLIYIFNNEYFSVNFYHKYKLKELEIRNNLKLGVPTSKEFHIEDEVSIFFNEQKNNKFIDVEAIIYQDGQFIVSNDVEIEIDKKNYNLIFNKGERVILNDSEKSKTNFDKFIYSIHNEDIEILMMDKEHYNTLSLLKNNEKEFYFHAHNRIYQYILTFFILLLTSKLFFFYKSKKNVLKYYAIIFLVLLGIQVINSYLIYLLNYNEIFNLYFYYIINLLILSIFNYLIIRLNENN